MAEQWFSIVEYARTFKVSDMTVRRRIKTGKLHAVLKDGKYFIPVQPEDGRRSAAPQPTPTAPGQPQQQRRPGEMTVIKAHPSAQSTYGSFAAPEMHHAQPSYQPRQVAQTYAAPVVEVETESRDTHVPQSLTRPLAAQDTSLVDTRALLAFCEASLRKLNDSERRTVEKFKSKLEALEANLVARDHEIKALRQQVEDLQVLVKILERK